MGATALNLEVAGCHGLSSTRAATALALTGSEDGTRGTRRSARARPARGARVGRSPVGRAGLP
jgi:hypothetical protein